MSPQNPETIRDVILQSGINFASCEFILGRDRPPLTYSDFRDQFFYVEKTLRQAGLGLDARVGVKIPNGPDLASCLLCVMGSATCIPMHTDTPELEIARVAKPLKLEAIILTADDAMSETEFWTSHGVMVITLCKNVEDISGQFTLEANDTRPKASAGIVSPSDFAIILLTSGTTASPKLVPHTQSSIVFSAVCSRQFFNYTKDDRTVSVMPLIHGQGLFVGLLPVLASGGSIACGEKLEPEHFLELYQNFTPTWFTAIPSFYQALLTYTESHQTSLKKDQLRFLRTGSAHMNTELIEDVETLFDAPLLMGYGSAEGSNISNNPIPPAVNKPGTVGISYGQEVAIMDAMGKLLGPNKLGEVVLRGDGVTSGYLENPKANAELFKNGWLRTGDLGELDAEGYLTLAGRLKEQINRGGESVSPLEIEEAIRSHPSIKAAAVFAIEHPTLGEDIAAAIVSEEEDLNDRKLAQYLASSLSISKIPHEFIFLEKLPVTHIGKIDKSELSNLLAVQKAQRKSTDSVAPRNELEKTIKNIWIEVLNKKNVSVTDHFLDLGGDSLSAMMIITRISERIGVNLEFSTLFTCPTIADQAEQIQSQMGC